MTRELKPGWSIEKAPADPPRTTRVSVYVQKAGETSRRAVATFHFVHPPEQDPLDMLQAIYPAPFQDRPVQAQ